MASCNCRGVANVVVPDAGDENERGVPKAVTKEGGTSVVPERLKKMLLTVTTFGWLKTLKASSIRRTRIDSLNEILRVTRASNWKTDGVVNWLRAVPGRRSFERLPSLFGSLPTSAE